MIDGPLCFILYIIEVARGVCKSNDEEDTEEKVEKRYENSIGSGFV